MLLDTTHLTQFDQDGYLVLEDILDYQKDLQPIVDEYGNLIDDLAQKWYDEGTLSSNYKNVPLEEKICAIAKETEGKYYSWIDISFTESQFGVEDRIHNGEAVFNLLKNPRLLDMIEQVIGPEIFSNPVQHVRIKPPEHFLSAEARDNTYTGKTFWHQDLGAVTDEADNSNILTVWVPITAANTNNGCLQVVRGSHKNGLGLHCFGKEQVQGIPEDRISGEIVSLPMNPGDILFMNKLTAHTSLRNTSDEIRWSFDLRYNPIGEPTGRSWFPGFVARSRANPDSELHDFREWGKLWSDTAIKLTEANSPAFRRWDPEDPLCA